MTSAASRSISQDPQYVRLHRLRTEFDRIQRTSSFGIQGADRLEKLSQLIFEINPILKQVAANASPPPPNSFEELAAGARQQIDNVIKGYTQATYVAKMRECQKELESLIKGDDILTGLDKKTTDRIEFIFKLAKGCDIVLIAKGVSLNKIYNNIKKLELQHRRNQEISALYEELQAAYKECKQILTMPKGSPSVGAYLNRVLFQMNGVMEKLSRVEKLSVPIQLRFTDQFQKLDKVIKEIQDTHIKAKAPVQAQADRLHKELDAAQKKCDQLVKHTSIFMIEGRLDDVLIQRDKIMVELRELSEREYMLFDGKIKKLDQTIRQVRDENQMNVPTRIETILGLKDKIALAFKYLDLAGTSDDMKKEIKKIEHLQEQIKPLKMRPKEYGFSYFEGISQRLEIYRDRIYPRGYKKQFDAILAECERIEKMFVGSPSVLTYLHKVLEQYENVKGRTDKSLYSDQLTVIDHFISLIKEKHKVVPENFKQPNQIKAPVAPISYASAFEANQHKSEMAARRRVLPQTAPLGPTMVLLPPSVMQTLPPGAAAVRRLPGNGIHTVSSTSSGPIQTIVGPAAAAATDLASPPPIQTSPPPFTNAPDSSEAVILPKTPTFRERAWSWGTWISSGAGNLAANIGRIWNNTFQVTPNASEEQEYGSRRKRKRKVVVDTEDTSIDE